MQMHKLVIANIHVVADDQLFTAVIYDEQGHYHSELLRQWNPSDIANELRQLRLLDDDALEIWTSSPEIYVGLVKYAGIGVVMKHTTETSDTNHLADKYRTAIAEIYKIKHKPSSDRTELSKGRRVIIGLLNSLTKLKGDRKS